MNFIIFCVKRNIMTSGRHSLFVQTLEFLFRARQSVNDAFFAERFSSALAAVLLAHVAYYSAAADRGAQARAYIRACKDMAGVLEAIGYLNAADGLLVAAAQERLLLYILEFLRSAENIPDKRSSPQEIAPPVVSKAITSASRPVRSKIPQKNSNQDKILDFVRRVPDCRPKDIIGEFSALSQRTVKRSLKELSEAGLIIKKTTEDKAVYYSAVS